MTSYPAPSDSAFALAFDHVPQGVAVFDARLHLTRSNRRYNDLLALPPDLAIPGTTLFDIALFLAQRGDFGPGDPSQLALARIGQLTASPTTVSQRLGSGGQMLEFHTSRLPDGGLVISFTDVTARIRPSANSNG